MVVAVMLVSVFAGCKDTTAETKYVDADPFDPGGSSEFSGAPDRTYHSLGQFSGPKDGWGSAVYWIQHPEEGIAIGLIEEDDDGITINLAYGDEPVAIDGSSDLDDHGLFIENEKAVTIDGHGRTVDLTGTLGELGESLITVKGEGRLTLKNIIFTGLNGGSEGINNAPLISVIEGGTLILGEGAVISDNHNGGTYKGAGVFISQGTLTMEAGSKITNNTRGGYNANGDGASGGAGVFVGADDGPSEFIMTGGEISGNTAAFGGGVLVQNGMFRMEGGKIHNNTASTFSTSNGIAAAGGGVFVNKDGAFEKTGGIIYGSDDGAMANISSPISAGTQGYGNSIYAPKVFFKDGDGFTIVPQNGGGDITEAIMRNKTLYANDSLDIPTLTSNDPDDPDNPDSRDDLAGSTDPSD
jgi:hypothetical protein